MGVVHRGSYITFFSHLVFLVLDLPVFLYAVSRAPPPAEPRAQMTGGLSQLQASLEPSVNVDGV